jgi:hypothetical protein
MRYFVTFLAGMLFMLFILALGDNFATTQYKPLSDCGHAHSGVAERLECMRGRTVLQKCWHKHSGLAERHDCRKLQMQFLLEK